MNYEFVSRAANELMKAGQSMVRAAEVLARTYEEADTAPHSDTVATNGIRQDVESVVTMEEPTKAEVLARLKTLCKQGHSAEIKEIIGHYGVNTLTEVDPRRYRDLLAEVGRLEDNEHDMEGK